jgi:hypothetical protein
VLGTARKLADDFFKKFAETVAPGTAAEKVAIAAEGQAS